MKNIWGLLVGALLIPQALMAQDVDDLFDEFGEFGPKWYFAELSLSAGNAQLKLDNVIDEPTLGSFMPSATLGVHIAGKLYVGGSIGVQLVNQYSGLTSDGNFRGQRITPISPGLIFEVPFGYFKANYIFLGNYRLLKDTASGKSVEYSDPQGFRLSGSFLKLKSLRFGLYFEKIWYTKTKLNSSESDLSSRLQSFGLEMSYRI